MKSVTEFIKEILRVIRTNLLEIIFVVFILNGCMNVEEDTDTHSLYTSPKYDVNLVVTKDTITIKFDDETFSENYSNTININGSDYITYYNDITSTLIIYDLLKGRPIKKINLLIEKGNANSLHGASVFFLNFDSIFVANKSKLYRYDGTGKIRDQFDLATNKILFVGFRPSPSPIIAGDNLLFSGFPYKANYVSEYKKRWPVMYKVNLATKQFDAIYHLPNMYRNSFYPATFLVPYYCLNSEGGYVFSFAADTNIYQTNFTQ